MGEKMGFTAAAGEKGNLMCTFAALILYDDNAPVTSENISKLLAASNNECEAYMPKIFADLCGKKDIKELLAKGGSGGGGGGGGAAAAGDEEEKKEEEEEEEEEEEAADMGGLFGDDGGDADY